MQSRSVLQLYYADHAFTDSLRTICQNAISSIHDDESDTNFNQLFNEIKEYWNTDHNIEIMLTVPSSIGSDKPMNNISLFLNYLPLVHMNNTTQPKTTGAKVSFCDRLTADWANQRVRIAFRTAIDIIYATFSTLVLQNNELSVEEVESVITQMQNYLDLDNEYPDSGKFRIISSRYFAKVIEVLSKAQPEVVFNIFFSSLQKIVKTIKKQSSQETDQKYLLNIVLCLYSNLKTDNSQFTIDTKQFDKVFSSLYSILSKKSRYDSTLQKDACICLINFFGVILTDRPSLRDSNFLNNMVKLTHSHSKIFSIFFMLLTLLYCFDKSKHMASEKKKFLTKIFSLKYNNHGDALNVFTYFLRGELYVSKSEIDLRNTSLTEKDFSWVPDQCVNQEALNKMSQFIFTNPIAFESYQSELGDFLIQYASLNYTVFINNFLEKILDMSFFKPNTMAVLSVSKVLLIAGKKSSIPKELINKMHRMLTTAVSDVMKNAIVDEGKSCIALHVLPFWPIYTSHEMNYNESINHITQCCNPLSFHVHIENITKIVKSKWSVCSSFFVKTNIFDAVESPFQIYNNVSTTDQLLIDVMTIVPHFPNEKSLVKGVVSLIFSPLTDVSALAIRLVQMILIKNNDCNIFEYILTEAFNLNNFSNEILYLMLYTIDQLLDLAINLRLNLDDNIIDRINFGSIISLCSQNPAVHKAAFSVLSHLHSIQPVNSIDLLLERYDEFISYQSKRSALLTASENFNFIHDSPNIPFKSMANSNYARLYLFYIASLGRCFSIEADEMNTKSLITMILNMNLENKKWGTYIFTGIVTFLVNAFNINMAYDDSNFFKIYKQKVCDAFLKDPRLDEWTGFHIFSAVDCAIDPSMIKSNILNQNQDQNMKKYHEENARYRYNSAILTDDEINSITLNNNRNSNYSILNDQGNKNDDADLIFEFFSIKPSSNVIIQAIALGIRTSIVDSIEIETATNYITYLSTIVKYFKKSKLFHSKLTFSYSASVFVQFEAVVRVVLDAAAALFTVFYEKFKKVPAGPYLRKEIVGKNVSEYIDIEQWFSFILNFIPHKSKKSLVIQPAKKSENSNPVRVSALNALSSLLSISPPPNSIYSKFIKNISKYDDRSLSLILSYYTEKLLPTFVRKALSSEYIHSTRYFHAIVNQFMDILPKDIIPKLMSNSVNSTMSHDEISFADTFFAHTGTIIALAFTRITTDNKEARLQAFSLLFNAAVGAAAYLNKPESVVIISDQMQSLMFTITSQLTNLYMSALQSISMLLSTELNIVSEQLISIILDSMANGGNSVLLASILAPWIKGPKFDDDSPIVFTATQPQFACFTRFSFAKSFSRIKLTTPLFFVIDSLLTTQGAASFLTIALSSLYQSDPLSTSNVTSTISYILQQRPSECVPLITSLFMFSTWFYYNIQLKSIDNSNLSEVSLSKPKSRKSSSDKSIDKIGSPNKKSRASNHKHQNSHTHFNISRGSTFLNAPINLTPPDSPDIPKLPQSSSDPNLVKTYEQLEEGFQQKDSTYDYVIQFAVTTISSTNLEIYNGYEHRLLAHALITLDSATSSGSSSLIPFLIPKLPAILKKIYSNNEGPRERNKSNADLNIKSGENSNEKFDLDSFNFADNSSSLFNLVDFESLVMKEIRDKGTEFAQKLGMECLTWGLCCGNLNYAIRALFLYRKILMPANLQIINKLIDCLKLASNSHKENRKNAENAELLKSYVANCLETIRVIAVKNNTRTIELWDLCIDFLGVNNPEIQTISFNFLTFLVSDINFVRNRIHFASRPNVSDEKAERRHSSTSFKITASVLDQMNNEPPKFVSSLINKINCIFDKESFLSFFNLVLCTSYEDLFEIVGSPEFVSVFILLLLPIVNTYNNQNKSLNVNENKTTTVNNNNNNNSSDITNTITLNTTRSKSRRKSIIAMDGQIRRNSLVEKTEKISKLVSNRFSNGNASLENNDSPISGTNNNSNNQGRGSVIDPSIDVDLSFFSLFEAKIDDFMAANKLNELAQLTAEDIKEENSLDTALYISQNLMDKNELATLCKLLAVALSFSSFTQSKNINNLNLNSNSNLSINSNSNISINSSQSSVPDQQTLIYSDNSYIYKFALEMIKSEKCDPKIFIPIAKAEDSNVLDIQAKEELTNEIQKVTGMDLSTHPNTNLFLASTNDINSEAQKIEKTDENSENTQEGQENDTPSSSVALIVNLPTYPCHPINNNFSSSNDFSTINILPPLYILNIKDCRSNMTVLKAIQRIRAQPLNDWTDLMFKAETTATQVEVLKSRKMNKLCYFNDKLFLKQLRNVISSKSKTQERHRERRISSDMITLVDTDEDTNFANFDINLIINESFALDVEDVDQIWKETIKDSENNYDTLSSIKL